MAKYAKPLLDLEGSVNPGDEPFVDVGTIFAEDDLDIPGRPPMSAIFIPNAFKPTREVDMILYLHGHGNSASIQGYLRSYKLRELVEASGKNVVFIAPTLGTRSEAGLLRQRGVIQTYLDDMMGFLHDYGPYETAAPNPKVRKIILAAHSGGGVAMADIADNLVSTPIDNPECWGFDCLYDTDTPLAAPAPLTIKEPSHKAAASQSAWESYMRNSMEGFWVKWSSSTAGVFKAYYGGGGTLTRTANLQLYASQQYARGVKVSPSFYTGSPLAAANPIPAPVSPHDFVPKTVLGRCLQETMELS